MKYYLTTLLLLCVLTLGAQPKVVAHRGYWDTEGSAQNSIASLQKAGAIHCYGSEFDVSITQDGMCVVNHDDNIDGITIETANYDDIKNCHLKNGEKLPTLAQYLREGKNWPQLQMILEIKPHKEKVNENRAVDATVELVKRFGMENQVEFISFSMNICERLHQLMPASKIAYLNGDVSPKTIKQKGLTGIDYEKSVFLKTHPEWLDEARQENVEVNVWTVNDIETLKHFAEDQRIQLITTNAPVQLQEIIKQK